MTALYRITLGLACLAGLASAAAAQDGVMVQADGQPGMFTLGPVDGGGPLFLSPGAVPPGVGDPGINPALTAGTVGGRGVNNDLANLEVGFDYFRPLWSFRDFTLAAPPGAGGFPVLGDAGHVDDHFGLAPHVNFHYQFPNSDLGIGASGSFLNLNGHLQQNLASTVGGTGQLTATSNLTIVNANLPELTHSFIFGDVRKHQARCFPSLDDMEVDLSFGSRYSSISQNYDVALTNGGVGSNISHRSSTQAFQGFGITSAVNCSIPVSENWVLFSKTRGSILVGDNARHSSLSVDVAGVPGIAATIDEDKTVFLPIGELEAGVEWNNILANATGSADRGMKFFVKASLVGQIWGDVGPLSAGSSQAFRQSDLFLVGATVLVGVQH